MSLLLSCKRREHNLNKYNARQKNSAMTSHKEINGKIILTGVIKKVFVEEGIKAVD